MDDEEKRLLKLVMDACEEAKKESPENVTKTNLNTFSEKVTVWFIGDVKIVISEPKERVEMWDLCNCI